MMRSFIVTLKNKRIFLFELLIQMSTLCLYSASTIRDPQEMSMICEIGSAFFRFAFEKWKSEGLS